MSSIAFWLALLIALLPIGWALARCVPHRVRWAREAAAVRLLGDTDLFALPALSHLSLGALAAVGPHPTAAWRAGDPVVSQALAGCELARLGLRRPPTAPRSMPG